MSQLPANDDWRPLREAPHDGTWVLIAVSPGKDRTGFVSFGRWVYPHEAEAIGLLGKAKRARVEAAGGWWTNSATLRPLPRPVLAWRPAPTFDFAAHVAEQDERGEAA